MTGNWPDIIRAAASSSLGIVALVVLVLGAIAWGYFRKESVRYRLIAFGVIVIGGGLLVKAVLHESHRDIGGGQGVPSFTTNMTTDTTADLTASGGTAETTTTDAPATSEPSGHAPTPVTDVRPSAPVPTALMPDLMNMPIWDALPLLKAAGFDVPEVDLTRDDNYVVGGRISPPGSIMAVTDVAGTPLEAGKSYPTTTRARIRVQTNVGWNRRGGIYSDPREVEDLSRFMTAKETESEQAHKGAALLKSR